MSTAQSMIVVADAECSLELRYMLRWEAHGIFQGRDVTVYGHQSQNEAVEAWRNAAELVAARAKGSSDSKPPISPTSAPDRR